MGYIGFVILERLASSEFFKIAYSLEYLLIFQESTEYDECGSLHRQLG